MKKVAWLVMIAMLALLLGACSGSSSDENEKPVDQEGMQDEAGIEEDAGSANKESTGTTKDRFIDPELADNEKYVEVMNRIHGEPNKLEVPKGDQYAAVTKLFKLNPEVLNVKARGLGLEDAHLSDGTKLVYLMAVGQGAGAFYFYNPQTDELVTELNAEEEWGEQPELAME